MKVKMTWLEKDPNLWIYISTVFICRWINRQITVSFSIICNSQYWSKCFEIIRDALFCANRGINSLETQLSTWIMNWMRWLREVVVYFCILVTALRPQYEEKKKKNQSKDAGEFVFWTVLEIKQLESNSRNQITI